MASVFCVKGDIKADLKTFGSDEAIRLPLSALVNRRRVKVKHRHSARFLGFMTCSEIGLLRAENEIN